MLSSMNQNRKNKTTCQALCIFAIVLVALSALLTGEFTNAIDDTSSSNLQWAMEFGIQNANPNAEESVSDVFATLDMVRLYANVTYNGAPQPNMLISFKVHGPATSDGPINITRIATSNADGLAEFSFRIPNGQCEGSPIGEWQTIATVQTTNGVIEKTLNFTVAWPLKILGMTVLDSAGQNQTVFSSGENVTVDLMLNNSNQLPQTANVTITFADASLKIVNSTQIVNAVINSGSENHVLASVQLPANLTLGRGTVNATVYAGNQPDVKNPACQTITTHLSIVNNTLVIDGKGDKQEGEASLLYSLNFFLGLLLVTGLSTFSVLFFFLKRRPMRLGLHSPTLPRTGPGASSSSVSSKSKILGASALEPRVSGDRTMKATSASSASSPQMSASTEALATLIALDELGGSADSVLVAEGDASVSAVIDRVISTARRIQAMKVVLESERKQLAHDLALVGMNIDLQDASVNAKLKAMQREVERLKAMSGKVSFVKNERENLNTLATETDEVLPEDEDSQEEASTEQESKEN